MNIFDVIKKDILQITKLILQDMEIHNLNIENYEQHITIEYPNKEEHGDLSTNIAMILAKPVQVSSKRLAENFLPLLQKLEYVEEVEVAGPGFINLKIKIEFWQNVVLQVCGANMDYSSSSHGQGEKVNVEFVSANPTGPMHVGHARGAIIGDAIAAVLSKTGFNVTKEYYINDAGKQIDVLIESFWIRYQQHFGKDIPLKKGCYPGEYLVEASQNLIHLEGAKYLEMDEVEAKKQLRPIVLEMMINMIRDDLKKLNVVHDVFISEQNDIINQHKLEKALDLLHHKGNALYRGTLEKPKSGDVEDWEPKEQLLLKTTLYGDDVDRSVLRSDGSGTYFASDIAYHFDKINRGFNKMIVLLGADHCGYIKRLEATVGMLSDGKANIKVLINQLVNLMQNGQPIKMSKRAGTFLTLCEVVDALGPEALRFAILMRKSDTIFDLDFDKTREQSKDNPLFYVQYAHTRCVSVLQNARNDGVLEKEELLITEEQKTDQSRGIAYKCGIQMDKIELSLLKHPAEKKLLKEIALLPKVVESAAIHYEPHRIGYYLYNLANYFHQMWMCGVSDNSARFIILEDLNLSRARAVLAYATASVLGEGLHLLGINGMLRM
jgi:arginyl-tRNA synthetase